MGTIGGVIRRPPFPAAGRPHLPVDSRGGLRCDRLAADPTPSPDAGFHPRTRTNPPASLSPAKKAIDKSAVREYSSACVTVNAIAARYKK